MNNSSKFSFTSDVSYLCGRDPSLRPGERPRPLNLLTQFGEAKKETDDAVKVYLRIKPSDEDTGKVFTKIDDQKLFVDHPRESTSSYKSEHARRYSEQFVFTKILSSGVDQCQVFRECALQPLKNFIQGDNCLVFTYGTTNAGKTFTIRGDARNPGIIPRALDFLFTSLGDRILDSPFQLTSGCSLRAFDSDSSMILDKRIMLETCLLDQYKRYDRKQTSTSSLNSDTASDASSMFQDMEFHMKQEIFADSLLSDLEEDTRYLVYVSFAEIYNENIYDLLQSPNTRQVCGWRRTPLQLGLDTDGKTYIKDLKHFQVSSGYEAYRIMLYGQHNLHIAGTELNSASSRSHCIFNVKLVKCKGSFTDTSISTFSFCDLAGSERAKKTHNFGERMRESQNINTSLLVLGRCLSALRTNQQTKDKLQVPFRDSKLTRLFKEPLMRKGCVSIIVNVNLDPYLYEETLNVLKFSAIAREVVLPPRQRKQPPARMSIFAKHLQKRRQTIRESTIDGSIASLKDSSVTSTESLVKLLERLQTELQQERSRSATLAQQLRAKERESAAKDRAFALREDNLRSELVRDFQDSLQDIVTRYEESRESLEYRLEDMANFRLRLAEKKYSSQLDKLKRQLKKRKFQDEDIEECTEESALEERLRESEAQLAASQQEIQGLQAERDALRATVTMQCQQTNTLQERVTRLELQLKMSLPPVVEGDTAAQDDLLSCMRQQLQELSNQKRTLEEEVRELKATVESAAEDHEELLEEKNKLEKECFSLEKTLVEKEVEIGELNSRVETYEANFIKQAQNLDLLKKVADDRLQDLEVKEKHICELKLKIEELSLSNEKRCSLPGAADCVSSNRDCKDACILAVQKDEELLQRIQTLETTLCKKEGDLVELKQTLSTKRAETKRSKVEAITQTEEGEEESRESFKREVDEQMDDLMALNKDLKEALEQKALDIEELVNRMITFQGNHNSLSRELAQVENLAHERLESLQEKELCVEELKLKVEEFYLLEQNWKHELQELINKNRNLEAKLLEIEERRVSEAETLQIEIKNLLQRVRILEISVGEKDAELHGLQSDLKKEIAKGMKLSKEVAELTEEINKKKSEYYHAITVKEAVLKDKIEHFSYENEELRNTLAQLEKEKEKQCQQHESLFKVYEDRLKQKAEEMERYKRDAQHCQDLLYKNTPTPNKETQEVIKGLKNELRKKDSLLVDLERKVAFMKIQIGKDMQSKTSDIEYTDKSPVREKSKENREPSKSTSKKNEGRSARTTQPKPRSTRGASSTDPKPESPAVSKTKMKLRKQLFTLNNNSFVDVGEDQWEPLHSKGKETKKKPKSPNTVLKRSLRAKP